MNKEQFLAMSLLHELRVLRGDNRTILKVSGVDVDCESILFMENRMTTCGSINHSKPILHPLPDLTKPIEHNGEVLTLSEMLDLAPNEMSLNHFISMIQNEYITIKEFMILIEYHFDVAGLIENGEAIDVNTLPENPYK